MCDITSVVDHCVVDMLLRAGAAQPGAFGAHRPCCRAGTSTAVGHCLLFALCAVPPCTYPNTCLPSDVCVRLSVQHTGITPSVKAASEDHAYLTPKSKKLLRHILFQIERCGEDDATAAGTEQAPSARAASGAARGKVASASAVGRHIMISYAWEQQETVMRIRRALGERGYTCWVDLEQMQVGDSLLHVPACLPAPCTLPCRAFLSRHRLTLPILPLPLFCVSMFISYSCVHVPASPHPLAPTPGIHGHRDGRGDRRRSKDSLLHQRRL